MPTAPTRRADPGLPKAKTHQHRTNAADPVRFRKRVERAIEGLVALLDTLDGDADFEPDGSDEPSLGFLEGRSQLRINAGCHDDREVDADFEPSLGFLERHPPVWFGGGDYTTAGSQLYLNGGSYDDREAEHDGSEPDADDEPSLGATATIDQRKAWHRPFDDSFSPDREDDGSAPSSTFRAAAR